ncbi:EAL domain-containing protein [Terasakiella pusilla]|uniref:EAL domain-containing protein n=1 Tax=Terasakiella pusilla TaxID=64973 RepID=UPI003AA7C0F7
MTHCLKCDKLPTLATGHLAVYFWPPLGHTTAKLKSILKDYDQFAPIEGGLTFSIKSQDMPELIHKIDLKLSQSEKQDTNCLLQENRRQPNLADFRCVTSLQKMTGLYGSKWLLDILEQKRMTSMFQPIVHAQHPNVPFAHECLLRWYDENQQLNSPARLFKSAQDADLIFPLDRAAREIHIRNAAAADMPSKIFVNFAPTAIYDPNNCLKSTFKVIREVGIDPANIVFEVVETERISDPEHLKNILAAYKQQGFGVALDDLGSGHSTLNMLGALKPDYVKLDMEMIRDVHKDRFKSELVRKIVELSHSFDIKVVAEGIETKEEAAWLVSQDVDFMQGFHFAKPDKTPKKTLDRRAAA